MKNGYTLVELLIVIAIVGVLASIVTITLNPLQQLGKANDAKRKQDLGEVQRGLELYYQDNERYPAALTFGSTGLQPYINRVPKDPSSSKSYIYIVSSDGQAYYLYASLDIASDAQACSGGGKCQYAPDNGCQAVCNYGVTSSNVLP